MNLADLLDENLSKAPLESAFKDEVIAELVELLVRAHKIADRQRALDALYAREAQGSTGIGSGVAIPHARDPEVEGVVLAVGVSSDGIEFDAVDGEPVHLVFLLLAAPDKPELNVETLADIGNLVQMPGMYEKLVAARDSAALIQTIREAQQEQ